MKYSKGDKVTYKGEPWKVTALLGDEYMISRDDPKSDWSEELIVSEEELSSEDKKECNESTMNINVKSFKESVKVSKKEAVATSEEEILQQVRRLIQEKGLLNTNISKDGDGSYYVTNNPDGGIPNGFLEKSLMEFEYLYPGQFDYEGGDFDNHLYFRITVAK